MSDFNLQEFVKCKISKERLTEKEFDAVYYWISDNKDSFDSPFKEGILKLINNETADRM